LSLPSDVGVSGRDYEKWLTNLLQEQGFAGLTVTAKPVDLKSGVTATGAAATKAVPVYAKLGFSVTGRASLANLVKLLEKFYMRRAACTRFGRYHPEAVDADCPATTHRTWTSTWRSRP